MAVNKVIVDDEILIDLTQDTVNPEDVRDGIIFHTKDGKSARGTCYMEDNRGESENFIFHNKGLTNKILYMGDILLDLSNDTITPYDVKEGKIFHMRNGELCEGVYVQPLYSPKIIIQCQDKTVSLLKNMKSSFTYDEDNNKLSVTFKRVTNDSSVVFRYKIRNKDYQLFRVGQRINMKCSISSDISNSQVIAHSNTTVSIVGHTTPSVTNKSYVIFEKEPFSSASKDVSFIIEEESQYLTLDFNVNFVNDESFNIRIDNFTINEEIIKTGNKLSGSVGLPCVNFYNDILFCALDYFRRYAGNDGSCAEKNLPYYIIFTQIDSSERQGIGIIFSKEPCVIVKNINTSIKHTYIIQHNENNFYCSAMCSKSTSVEGGFNSYQSGQHVESRIAAFSSFDEILCSNYDVLYNGNIVAESKPLENNSITLFQNDNYYKRRGNVFSLINGTMYCDIYSQENTTCVCARINGDFINPKITLDFSFGESDLISDLIYEHHLLTWNIKFGETYEPYNFDEKDKYDCVVIANGNDYENKTIYDKAFELDCGNNSETKNKLYHSIYFVVESKASDSIGVAKSWLSNIRINGEKIKDGGEIIS